LEHLELTIHQSSPARIYSKTIADYDSVRFGPYYYNTSGSYALHYTNAMDCDSTEILNLTVLKTDYPEMEHYFICQGDPKGVYNWDTNTWDFKGEVIGDMDGIIEIRDENGILLANCTVNGDTEYFGRYNYTVRVDNNGDMYLDVGWNSREGRAYAADGLDNDTRVKATVLPASGKQYTIDSTSDVDWFSFSLDTIGRSSSYIGIEFKQWAGDLDLYLYDSAGNQLDYAKSVTDNERISLKGVVAGDYYVKVVGFEDNINEYKLVYNLPEPIVLNDDYENGDNNAHSYHLGKLSEKITDALSLSGILPQSRTCKTGCRTEHRLC
jgi:hypothetical protein